MQRSKKYIITYLIAGLLLNSCSYNLNIDVEQPDALIVVDGWIEKGDQAKVFLTTNTPYFTTIDSSSLRDLVLSRAKVTLNDGENSEVLILRKDARYFPPYYYAGNTIFGESGKVYTLNADYGGKSIVAQTSIPQKVNIDTCYFELNEGMTDLGYIRLIFTDPSDEKNYYRIFTQRLGKDEKFISTFIIAINDQYFNGEQISYSISRAPESFLSSEENDFFESGDTILVKLSTMDQASFEFWNSYQEEVINATNPFASSSVNLNTNISGEGLGVWGGYNSVIDTVFTSSE